MVYTGSMLCINVQFSTDNYVVECVLVQKQLLISETFQLLKMIIKSIFL